MTLAEALSETDIAELAVRIQQIPAPTFAEGERASYVHSHLANCCPDAYLLVHDDATVNVYARVPGAATRVSAPALLVGAHTDTVFPAGTDLTVRRDPQHRRIHGPGIGDNSLAVAALLALAAALARSSQPLACDVWLVANAAEEGLGDLRGMRAAIEHVRSRHPAGIGAAVVLEGLALGSVYHGGIGVRRYRLTAQTAGGHSWGDHGAPSAVHEIVGMLARMVALELPAAPRTTLNIGRLSGGTSVNTIAAEAHAEIDLRSQTSDGVEALEERVRELVRAGRRPGVRTRMEKIGDRPAGAIAASHPLVVAALAAVAAAGLEPRLKTGSTDANALLAAGIPTVCVGVSTGAGAHRDDEYVNLDPIPQGVRQLALLVPEAAAIAGGSIREGEP